MAINDQFGDIEARGTTIRARVASSELEVQAIVRDVLAAGDFCGGAGSVAYREFVTQLRRNVQVIHEQANAQRQNVQTARSNVAGTDIAVGSRWT